MFNNNRKDKGIIPKVCNGILCLNYKLKELNEGKLRI